MSRTLALILVFVINFGLTFYLFNQKKQLIEYEKSLIQDLDRKLDIHQQLPAQIEMACKRDSKFRAWASFLKEMAPIAHGSIHNVDSLLTFILSANEREEITPKFTFPYLDSFPPAPRKIILIESIYHQILSRVSSENNERPYYGEDHIILESSKPMGDSMQLNMELVSLWKNQLIYLTRGSSLVFFKDGLVVNPFVYPLYYNGDPNKISLKITNPISKNSQTYHYEK